MERINVSLKYKCIFNGRMTTSAISELISYYQKVSEELTAKAAKAGIFENSVDIGTKREDYIIDLLSGHLPKRCDVTKGGYVFDSQGNKSKQMDVIVTNDLTLQFKESKATPYEKSFSCIEGCYSAISIKSFLNKAQLFDAIENLKSIPRMKKLNVNPLLAKTENLLKMMPYKVVFAYKGVEPTTLEDHIIEYGTIDNVADQNFPDLIIVNNSYFIWKVIADGIVTLGDTLIRSGSLVTESNSKFIGGFALMKMISEIQKISNFGSHILLSFKDYEDAARTSCLQSNDLPKPNILLRK